MDLGLIKVVINNRNRFTTTKNMVEDLLRLNPKEKIIILDNKSSYPPLLEWYQKMETLVDIRFLENEGHLALWTTGLNKELGDFFVYTDSDIILPQVFPKNWKDIMLKTLLEHPNFKKVALGIRIDDLPDHYKFKDQVVRFESRWWRIKIANELYRSHTDTTFCLLENFGDNCYPSIRLGMKNMVCQHHPWYLDLENLDGEEMYFLQHLSESVTTQYSKEHKKFISELNFHPGTKIEG